MSVVTTPNSTADRSGSGSDTRLLGLFTQGGVVWTAVILGAFLALFYRWVFRQGEISVHQMEDWGHAFVIPFISGYLVWRRREEISRARVALFWPAIAVFLLGIVSYMFCLIYVQNHMSQGFALVLTLGGLVLWLTGPEMLRYLFLPIAYLLLAVTVAESVMLAVTFKLQLIASQGSWVILNLIGQPFDWFTVEIQGNTLELLVYSSGEVLPMDVAEACSGMRMVVAFYALAGAVALLASNEWWQRIALMLLAGPVAIFMNMLRVTVLGLLMMIDPNLAAGDAHMIIGTILLFPSLLLFLGVVWALNRIVSPAQAEGSSG